MKRFSAIVLIPVLAIVAILVVLNQSSPVDANQGSANVRLVAADRDKAKADTEQDKPLLANFMRAKLTASGQVLEGLCTENFGTDHQRRQESAQGQPRGEVAGVE